MIVRNTERADDPKMLTSLGAPALELDMIVLGAGDGKRMVYTSVCRATRLSQITANPARVEPAFPQSVDDIRNSVTRHRLTLHICFGKKRLLIAAIFDENADFISRYLPAGLQSRLPVAAHL